MWCPLVVVTHLGAAMTLMMLSMSVSIAANCTVPSMDTACGGLELTLANCSLSSSVVITQPLIVNGDAYCGNITIVLSNISFVSNANDDGAVVLFNVVNGDFSNVSVLLERSFIRGTVAVAAWTWPRRVSDVSLRMEDTTVEEGRGMLIRGAASFSGRIDMTVRNVSWSLSTYLYSPLIFAIDSVNSTAMNTSKVSIALDGVVAVVTQYVVLGRWNLEAILICSTNFSSAVAISVTNCNFTGFVVMNQSMQLRLYSSIIHFVVGVLGPCDIYIRNVSMRVVQMTTTTNVSHTAALLALHCRFDSAVLFLSSAFVFAVESCQLHLEGSSASALLYAPSMRADNTTVVVLVTNCNLDFITHGNVSTLTLDMIKTNTIPLDISLRRHSSVVDLSSADYINQLSVTIDSCVVSLVVIVDNALDASNMVFDDSIISFQVSGIMTSNSSNTAVNIANTTFTGGIFRRSVAGPYVTIGCAHGMSVVSTGGYFPQQLRLAITNVTISFVDNVSYTAANPFFAAQVSGLGSVVIGMAVVTVSASLLGTHSTIEISHTSARFDVVHVSYFTEPQRGGAVVGMLTTSPVTYFFRHRGVRPKLLLGLFEGIVGNATALAWANTVVILNRSVLSLASSYVFPTTAARRTALYGCGGFLSAGVAFDGLNLTIAGCSSDSQLDAFVWVHTGGDAVANINVTNIDAPVVSKYSTVPPLFHFVNASLALSTVSLSASAVSAPISAASMDAPFALLFDAVNTTVRDSALVVSNTQFTAGSGGVLFGSGISWGKNATVGLVCGTTWNGLPLRPRTINVPMVVLKASEARRRQGLLLLPRAVGCPHPEAEVMYSYSATAEATATHGIEAPRSAVRGAVQPAAIVVASFTLALVPSVATVVPGLQVVSQLSIARRMCAASVGGGGGVPHPLSDAASNPFGVAIGSLGEELMFAGGSVVSSLVLGLVYAFVALGAAVLPSPTQWLARFRASSSVGAALRLPGSLYAPAMLVVQPLVTAAVVLLASPLRSAGSVVFGVAVFVASLPPLCVMMMKLLTGPCGTLKRRVLKQRHAVGAPWVVRIHSVVLMLSSERIEYVPCDEASRQHLDCYGCVISSFADGRQWFVVVEVSNAVVSGVLSGLVAGLNFATACTAAVLDGFSWAQTAVLVVVCVAVVSLRPYNSHFGNVLSAVALLLSAVCLVLQAVAPGASDAAVTGLTWTQVAIGLLPLLSFVSKVFISIQRNSNRELVSQIDSLNRRASDVAAQRPVGKRPVTVAGPPTAEYSSRRSPPRVEAPEERIATRSGANLEVLICVICQNSKGVARR